MYHRTGNRVVGGTQVAHPPPSMSECDHRLSPIPYLESSGSGQGSPTRPLASACLFNLSLTSTCPGSIFNLRSPPTPQRTPPWHSHPLPPRSLLFLVLFLSSSATLALESYGPPVVSPAAGSPEPLPLVADAAGHVWSTFFVLGSAILDIPDDARIARYDVQPDGSLLLAANYSLGLKGVAAMTADGHGNLLLVAYQQYSGIQVVRLAPNGAVLQAFVPPGLTSAADIAVDLVTGDILLAESYPRAWA